MKTSYISTAACRDHALRVREAAPRALSGASLIAMPPTANVAFTTVVPQQDRPPRGVPR
jgi:hypothetical protein